MMYKNRFLVLALCIFIGNVNASELSSTEEDSFEVVSASEMEELEELLKTIDSDEFLEAFQIAVDAMVEKTKIAGDAIVEKAKITADAMAESYKEALIKSSEQFGSEVVRQLKPILWALVFLYAAKSIRSVLNH